MNTEEKQTELQIIDPKEYGLEPVKANEMTSGLNSIIEERSALENIFNDIIVKELNADTLKEARELRLKIQKNRTQGIDVWHKTNKEFYLAGGRFVDAVKNREIAINTRLETTLGEIENHFKKLEEARLDKVKSDRVALLLPYGEVNQYIDLKAMDDTAFNNLLADTKLAYETRRENERLAELKRLEDEKKAEQERIESEKKEEEARLKKEQEDKAERERIEKENAELKKQQQQREESEKQRIAKELAKVEKFAKMLIADGFELSNNDSYIPKDQHKWCKDEYTVSFGQLTLIESGDELKELIDLTNSRIDDRKKAEKLQADKDAEISKLKAEQEAERLRKEKELADEKARIESEEADKLAKEKAALLAPERDKVKAFFEKFEELRKSFPDLTSDQGISLAKEVKESMLLVRSIIVNESKKLL